MAAPRAKPEIIAPDDVFPPQPFIPQQYQDAPDEGENALLNIIAELGGAIDAKVNVYRAEKGSRQMAYVGSYDACDFSLDAIKQEYGGGTYRIHARKDGQLVTNRLITVAEPKNPAPVIAHAAPALDQSQLLQTMQQGFAALGASLLEGISRLIPPPQPLAPVKTTQEMLQEMMLMKQLLAPSENAAPAVNQFDVFKQGMEFAANITPREGDVGTNELMLETIKTLGPVFGQALQKGPAMSEPQAPIPMLAAPQVNPIAYPNPQPHAQPDPLPQPGEPDVSIQEKMFFNLLISAAKSDADPSTYAALALDMVGDENAIKLVNLPDWFERLIERDGRAIAYRPWFEEMRTNIFLLTGDTPPDIPESNPTNSPDSDALIGQPANATN